VQSTQVAKGAIYITIYTILQYALSFIFYMAIARILGSEEIGRLSILLMIGAFFALTNLSINFSLQKFIPAYIENGKKREIGSIIKTGLEVLIYVSTPILAILLIFTSNLNIIIFPGQSETGTIAIILIATYILNFSLFFGGQMLGLGLFKETAIQNILNVGISRILALFLVSMGMGLIGVTLGWLIAGLAALIFSLYVLRNQIHLKNGFPKKRILEFSLPVHVFTTIIFLQSWMDIGILYILGNDVSEIGIYYLVVNAASILSIFYMPIIMVVLPALSSRYSRDGIKGIIPISNAYIRIVSKILIPIGVSFAVLSSAAIKIAYGSQYLSGTIPLAILAATALIPALLLLFVTIIQSIGNTKPLIIIGVAASITEVVLVGTLASSLGGTAGAIGRIAFSTVGVVIGYYYIHKNVKLRILPELVHPLLAALFLSIPLFVIDQYLENIIRLTLIIRVSIDIIALITIGLIFTRLTQYLTEDDFLLIKQALPSKFEGILTRIESILLR